MSRPLKTPPPRSLLISRILSALVLGPMALAAAYFGSLVFAAFLAIGAMIMVYEFIGMLRLSGGWPATFLTVSGFFALSLFLIADAGGGVLIWYLVVISTGGALAALGLLARRRRLVWLGGSVAYIWIPVLAFLWLRTTEDGLALVLWAFLLVWGTDIGGYFVGRAIGGVRLAPRISPNKTWSGLVGGIAFALAGSLFAWAVARPLPLVWMALLTPPLAVWSQIGDIAESALKRRWGAKDSGHIIPGHGGILDRVDGLMFVAPLLALFTFIFMMTRP
ncbi:MAG: phosphatidate cytidylyltransferase [Rhodothalassiaceae bacterium]